MTGYTENAKSTVDLRKRLWQDTTMRQPIFALVFLVLFLFLATSCSDKGKEDGERKSAGEIMRKYTETLATAPGKAKKAGEAVEKRNKEEEELLKEADR
ncbi:MAG: hypothetical protein HY890_06610 [Deltaproteobacteria bacterium]|nr:hypothetical protein [Deltaproteobacteria bacterium]